MDKDEALKLALEALEFIPESGSMLGAHAEAKRLEAITVIKEALAQPEQEPVAWQVKYRDDEGIPQIAWFHHPVHPKSPLAKRPYTEEPLYTTPPQRKPEQESDDLTIAYMSGVYDGKNKDAPQRKPEPVAMRYDFDGYGWLYIDNGSGSNWKEKIKNAEPLFTTPPRREWVGLTVREIEWCFYDANDARIVAARNIEIKLREKNGC